jgi:hypothetical protein
MYLPVVKQLPKISLVLLVDWVLELLQLPVQPRVQVQPTY